jgi:hypothetical protein
MKFVFKFIFEFSIQVSKTRYILSYPGAFFYDYRAARCARVAFVNQNKDRCIPYLNHIKYMFILFKVLKRH